MRPHDPASSGWLPFLLAALLLLTPVNLFWFSPASPWYLIFIVWAGVIAVIGFSNHRRRHDL